MKKKKPCASPTEFSLFKTSKIHKLSVPLLNGKQLPRLSLERREQDIERLNACQRPQPIVQTFNCNVI